LKHDHPPRQPAQARRHRPRAIGWFTAQGHDVLVPLTESIAYDLAVDDGHRLLRVQVKTTTRRTRNGNFHVMIETAGGNQSFHTRRPFNNTASDLLFILTDDGDMYVLPSLRVTCRRTVTLCAKYDE